MLAARAAALAAALVLTITTGPAGTVAASAGTEAGSHVSTQAKVFRSARCGFSFAYEKPFRVRRAKFRGKAGGRPALSVAAFDTRGSVVDGQYRDAFAVSVYRLNVAVTDDLLPAARQELKGVVRQLEAGDPTMRIRPLRRTVLNGLQGFQATARFQIAGTPIKSRLLFVFSGKREFQIVEQATAKRWTRLQPAFRAMRKSFTAY